MSTLPWDASTVDLVSKQVVEHIWKVEFPNLDVSRSTVPAWDIQVNLDGGRMPYGVANFKAPASYMAEVPDGSGTVFTKLVPYALPPVRIWAGWRYVKNGAVVEDLQILFSGFITTREFQFEEGRGYVQFTAQTAEAVYDQPNSRVTATTNVGNTWTSIKQGCTAIAGYPTPWYKVPEIVEEAGYMNTPTSAQLTSWRSGTFEPDDEVLDVLQSWAQELGQWIRGNVRSSLTTPSLLVSADPYPYRVAYTLPSSVFTRINRKDSLDDWANVLKFTTTWNNSAGDPVSKKRTYIGAGIAPGNTPGPVRMKSVTAYVKPPGGTLTATNTLALAWLRRIKDMSEVFFSAEGRAIWWLQPRIHGLQVSDLGLADAAGPISSVAFQVDSGTMTVAWNTSNARA